METPIPSSRPRPDRSLNASSRRLRRSSRTPAAPAVPLLSSTMTTTSMPSRLDSSFDATAEAAASPKSAQRLAPHATLGQFSYVPATQTTVVTTTTTTTTSFPPLLFNGLRDLADLDPQLYPLAASPTPSALKKITFDLGGTPACFEEAENASRTLEEFHRQRSSLDASGGVVTKIVRTEPTFELAKPRTNPADPASRFTASVAPFAAPGMSSRKRPASPVSIAEAAEQVRLRQESPARSTGSPSSATRRRLARPSHSTRPPTLRVPPHSAISTLTTPASSQAATFGSVHRRLERPRRPGSRNARETPVPNAEPQGTLSLPSPRLVSTKNVSFVDDDDLETVDGGSSTDQATLAGDDVMAVSAASIATATPPITDNDLQLAEPDYVTAGGAAGSHPDPDPPSPVSPALGQDASLPSPSLSPVTAALQHGIRRASVEDGEREDEADDDVDSSLELPPPHDLLLGAGTASTASRRRKRSPTRRASASTASGSTEPRSGTAHARSRTMMEMPSMLDTFDAMPPEMQTYMMYQFLRRCTKPTLRTVADIVSPALKVDFLVTLPPELGLNIIRYLDFRSLCRAAQVSKRWRQMIDSNERAWKELLDRDGYTLPPGELQRAIKEGWGWQVPHGEDDCEKDISGLGASRADGDASTSGFSSGTSATLAELDETAASPPRGRPKRKAAVKFQSRKKQKKKETARAKAAGNEVDDWMSEMAIAEGPYAAATAAARAVANPPIGLPSLRNLHLFKSIYRRNHVIRKCWMDEEVQPTHIAFRAHQRHVVTCLQFDWDKILTGSDDTNINVYDTRTGALRTRLEGHEGGVWALQYEGNTLVSGSTDRSVRVWDIERGVCTHIFQGHTSTVRCLQILMPTHVGYGSDGRSIRMPKEPLIITGSRDSTLRVWKLPKPGDEPYFPPTSSNGDADCPYFVRALTGHIHSVRAIAAHGDTLVSGSYDYTVRVWKLSNGELVHRLQGHTQKVYSVVLDHQRNRCISGSMDNLVKVWSLETGAVLFNLEGHTSLVGLLDLSHDRLVSAAADSTLRVWDPAFGQCRSTLRAHTGAITCFQHDGQKVVSGSDRTVKMWNVQTGAFVRDLLTDLSGVWQVKFNERRCVAAVQRNQMTYLEVLDFSTSRDAVPDGRRGRRIVVDAFGQEIPEGTEDVLDENVPAAIAPAAE